ncbi:energy-coupling factor ABC transporter substrate-binding protein [Brevibacillus ginsengisoli]|uniref:energy-coupling factor ABC transporter substrate-binding protein n=1 Tax=Brevibacillus ginsengisoli TaxID=363854 RepID=UPI003CF88862
MNKNWILLVAVVCLIVIPFMFQSHSEFSGTDGQATEVIQSLAPGYQPWVKNIWTPPGSEVESLLFALQAAIGAGALGYFIGVSRTKKLLKMDAEEHKKYVSNR